MTKQCEYFVGEVSVFLHLTDFFFTKLDLQAINLNDHDRKKKKKNQEKWMHECHGQLIGP